MKTKIKFIVGLCLPLFLVSCSALPGTDSPTSSGTIDNPTTDTTITGTGEDSTSNDATITPTTTDNTTTGGDSDALQVSGSAGRQTRDNTYHKINSTAGISTLNPVSRDQQILVIPVKFTDFASTATEARRSQIEQTFSGDSTSTGYESVSSYYEKSSYDACKLNFEVTPWYDTKISTTTLMNTKTNGQGEGQNDGGSWYVLESAISWYKTNNPAVDMTKFDNDKDGRIDGVWLIYGCPNSSNHDYSPKNADDEGFWAFTYWDFNNQSKTSLTDPKPYLYAWASYDFMDEGYGAGGKDAHTYIHETGHMLGLDDYYDASGSTSPYSPMGEVDMMDLNIGDHNAFTKYALGWATPTVVSTTTKVELASLTDTGASIILKPTNYNNRAFDEYIMISFITPTGLNKQDYVDGYAPRYGKGYSTAGVMITHVDARGIKWVSDTKSSLTNVWEEVEGTYGTNSAHSRNSALINIIPANYASSSTSSKNPFSSNYSSSNAALFKANSSFSLETGSVYRKIFGSTTTGTNKLNNGSIFNYKVEIESIGSTTAILNITTL